MSIVGFSPAQKRQWKPLRAHLRMRPHDRASAGQAVYHPSSLCSSHRSSTSVPDLPSHPPQELCSVILEGGTPDWVKFLLGLF